MKGQQFRRSRVCWYRHFWVVFFCLSEARSVLVSLGLLEPSQTSPGRFRGCWLCFCWLWSWLPHPVSTGVPRSRHTRSSRFQLLLGSSTDWLQDARAWDGSDGDTLLGSVWGLFWGTGLKYMLTWLSYSMYSMHCCNYSHAGSGTYWGFPVVVNILCWICGVPMKFEI